MPSVGDQNPERRGSDPVLIPIIRERVLSTSSHNDSFEEGEANVKELRLLLTDINYKNEFLTRLSTLRRDRELCDVVLFVNHREIYAHRVVLAALSPTLCEMLTDPEKCTFLPHDIHAASEPPVTNGETYTNGHSPTHARGATVNRLIYLEFPHADFDSFEALVKYGYTSKLEISDRKVAEAYKTACLLKIQSCAKACAKHLWENLSPLNCINIRKCANKTNDSLLAEKVDAFLQTNFWHVTQESKEFTSLPCVQVQVIAAPDVITGDLDGKLLAEKCLQWFQRQEQELPEFMEFRIDILTEKVHLLYLDKEFQLQDCWDLDDNSSVGSSDMVQDYKKTVVKKRSRSGHHPQQISPGTRTTSVSTPASTSGGKVHGFPSSESINSLGSSATDPDEIFWKVISVTRTTEKCDDNKRQYLIALVVLHCRLAAISIQLIENASLIIKQQKVDIDRNMLLARCIQGGQCRLPLPTMASHRCSVGAVNLNNKLVVCGGYDRGECLRSVEQFDPNIGCWQTLAPMTKERGRFDATVCDGKIYAVGGSDGNSDLRSVEIYNPENNVWEAGVDLRYARSNNGVTSVDGVVYCIGGGSGQTVIKECEQFCTPSAITEDSQNDTNIDSVEKSTQWEPIAPLLCGRYQAGCCSWNKKVFAIGGCDNWNCINTVEMYDPRTDSWRLLPPMHTARRGCGAIVVKNKLYVVGGSDGTQSLNSVEIYDLIDGVWSAGPSMSTPRANVDLVVLEDNLYAVGGFSGKVFLNTIEILDQGASEWRCWRKLDESIDEQPLLEGQCENEQTDT